MANLPLCVLLLFGLFRCGVSIMCYECNSAVNSLCGAKVLPASLQRNCTQHDRGVTHVLCRKIVQQIEHEINGHLPASRVIRTCGWDDTKYKGACYHRAGYGGKQEVCSCSTDLCNAAPALSVRCWLAAAAAALIHLLATHTFLNK